MVSEKLELTTADKGGLASWAAAGVSPGLVAEGVDQKASGHRQLGVVAVCADVKGRTPGGEGELGGEGGPGGGGMPGCPGPLPPVQLLCKQAGTPQTKCGN